MFVLDRIGLIRFDTLSMTGGVAKEALKEVQPGKELLVLFKLEMSFG
jgi:hypothetical protein